MTDERCMYLSIQQASTESELTVEVAQIAFRRDAVYCVLIILAGRLQHLPAALRHGDNSRLFVW